MNIFQQLFGGAPVAAPALANPNAPTGANNPGQPLPGTANGPGTAPNGVVPSPAPAPEAAPNSPTPSPTPMEGFKDIWNTVPTSGEDPNASIFANLDPNKVMESAKKLDFTKAIPQDVLAKIQAGGPEGAMALAQAMNLVGQTGYAQSAIATTKIVEAALKKQAEQFNASLPTLVKKFSANESILAENPLYQNPAIQPLVGALQEQLIRKNPNATTAEIQQQVGDFFKSLATSFAPAPVAPKTGKGKEEDWSAFLGS